LTDREEKKRFQRKKKRKKLLVVYLVLSVLYFSCNCVSKSRGEAECCGDDKEDDGVMRIEKAVLLFVCLFAKFPLKRHAQTVETYFMGKRWPWLCGRCCRAGSWNPDP
jgi:hypothetical protein